MRANADLYITLHESAIHNCWLLSIHSSVIWTLRHIHFATFQCFWKRCNSCWLEENISLSAFLSSIVRSVICDCPSANLMRDLGKRVMRKGYKNLKRELKGERDAFFAKKGSQLKKKSCLKRRWSIYNPHKHSYKRERHIFIIFWQG